MVFLNQHFKRQHEIMEGMLEKIGDDLGSSFSVYQHLYFFLIGQLSIIFLPGSINMVVIIISVDQHI